jgi:hypothetical protein
MVLAVGSSGVAGTSGSSLKQVDLVVQAGTNGYFRWVTAGQSASK